MVRKGRKEEMRLVPKGRKYCTVGRNSVVGRNDRVGGLNPAHAIYELKVRAKATVV